MDRETHWEHVFETKPQQDVSWFEAFPSTSISLLDAAGMHASSCVVDIGGGDSQLVDHLLQRGLTCVTVLDVSGAALRRAQARLGALAAIPKWLAADVTSQWTISPVDIWHDRAVFHFLTSETDRRNYLARLRSTLKLHGHAVIATFALDGPDKCSGLPVARYSPDTLSEVLGAEFRLAQSLHHQHLTPWGTAQAFQYSRFERTAMENP